MCGRKETKKLKNLLHTKEAERRLEHVKCCETKKQLAEVLKENAFLKHRADFLASEEHEHWMDVIAREKENDALKADITRRARLYQHGKERMAQELRELRETLAVYINNIKALSVNIEQGNQAYISLAQECSALRGKLDVYERVIGKIEDKQRDDRVQIQGEEISDQTGQQASADSAATAGGQELHGGAPAEQQERTGSEGTAESRTQVG